MNINNIEKSIQPVVSKGEQNQDTDNSFEKENLSKFVDNFLGDEKKHLKPETILKIIEEGIKMKMQIEEGLRISKNDKRNISYEKHKKAYWVGEEKGISIGKIVAMRRWGINGAFSRSLEPHTKDVEAHKILSEKLIEDWFHNKLNKELALELCQRTKRENLSVSKAYNEIAERSDIKSELLGIEAEQIIIGVLEGIAIDRQYLEFEILEANAHQDVYNKIDFIIRTKQNNRGVGVNRDETPFEEKSVGIQFTINTKMAEHKANQIAKSKERGVKVDDIVYVEIDKIMLQDAITKWENKGKPIVGPWEFLPVEIRTQTLKNLFHGILDEEKERSLLKNIR